MASLDSPLNDRRSIGSPDRTREDADPPSIAGLVIGWEKNYDDKILGERKKWEKGREGIRAGSL